MFKEVFSKIKSSRFNFSKSTVTKEIHSGSFGPTALFQISRVHSLTGLT